MKRYLIIVEKTQNGYSAYSPDVLGCIATGRTRKTVEKRMKEALEFHLDALRSQRRQLPRPHAYATYLAPAA